jgi:vacuolar-type H+-ATPase subunit I/STV1
MERVTPRRFTQRDSRRSSIPIFSSESMPADSNRNIQDDYPKNLENSDHLLSPGTGRQNNEYYELSEISTLFRDSIYEEIQSPAKFMEILIEHLVRVLKFVFGSISGVMSYLRLWGLSMAHYHLSKILVDTIL